MQGASNGNWRVSLEKK